MSDTSSAEENVYARVLPNKRNPGHRRTYPDMNSPRLTYPDLRKLPTFSTNVAVFALRQGYHDLLFLFTVDIRCKTIITFRQYHGLSALMVVAIAWYSKCLLNLPRHPAYQRLQRCASRRSRVRVVVEPLHFGGS
jgi:hypothetical protein